MIETEERFSEEPSLDAPSQGSMMPDDVGEPVAGRPSLARRFILFPLVRIVIGVVLLALAAGLTSAAARRVLAAVLGHATTGISFVVVLPTVAAGVGVYLLFVRWIERRPASELAFAEAPMGLASGIGLGVGIMGLTVGTIWLLRGYDVAGWNGLGALLAPLAIAVSSGFLEELVFRGVIFRITEEALGTWTALAITAALFGAAHLMNPNATIWGALAIALEAGFLLGAAYVAARSLWLPIGLHLGWNFAQAGLFGATVSGVDIRGLVTARFEGPDLLTGGAFGPEASIPAVAIGLATAVALLAIASGRRRLLAPVWRRGSDP